MSAPLKVGGYIPKWAPDRTAYFQWHTTFPCKVTRDPKCVHADTTWLEGQDTRSSDLQNYGGTVCCDCGKVLAFGEIDPVTGEPRAPNGPFIS